MHICLLVRNSTLRRIRRTIGRTVMVLLIQSGWTIAGESWEWIAQTVELLRRHCKHWASMDRRRLEILVVDDATLSFVNSGLLWLISLPLSLPLTHTHSRPPPTLLLVATDPSFCFHSPSLFLTFSLLPISFSLPLSLIFYSCQDREWQTSRS